MRVQLVTLLAALHYLAAAQTPPGFAPAAQQGLDVTFSNQGETVPRSDGILVSPKGKHDEATSSKTSSLTITDTTLPPAVLPLDQAFESFFLIMLDLDIAVNATFRTTLVQWMAQGLVNEGSSQNLSAASTEQDSIIAPYISPNPMAGTGKHRYLILLFAQPPQFQFPEAFDYLNRPTNETLRAALNVTKFAAAAGLGELVGATYWLEQSVNATSNGTTGPTGSATGSAAASRTLGPGTSLTPAPSPFTGTGHRLRSGALLTAGVSAVCTLALVLV
ncbi:MAG: hypothetical protein OHK93_000006 [Ramalina farinacea]|uniref:PEBP-like protein n=1 Tax=Ramalina farinacea TaxID=258253 RepID=A0AA43QE11_9LECA|nr:hypothetical protein [Ramalina farinacea]